MANRADKLLTAKVFRSDELYLVQRGENGQLVSKENGIGQLAPIGGLIRHVHVVEPWELVTDHALLPEIVKTAIAADRPVS